ncbi:xanthine dehydrogenase family protein molybdopterin-binding subunit [Alphaproteobacteria bacterium]|nr:xanthine dehydrogenase family protein molybdopterin-binding subunit [Alphaproteobacteria bacterium]
MGQFGVGQPVRRKEDSRLLTGNGKYLDDISLDNQAYAVVLRSPHANAKINSISTTDAESIMGVIKIITSEDLIKDKIGSIPCLANIESKDGSKMSNPKRELLARNHVRFVGDYVALVVAESAKIAREASELIEVDYEILESITKTKDAILESSPNVWEEFNSNRVFDWENGDLTAVNNAFKNASHISKIELTNNRVVVNSMEPRGAIGNFNKENNVYTLYTPCQHVHLMRDLISGALGIDKDNLRVISPDVGGGFGMKVFVYPEQGLIPYASKKIGRPVKWVSDRSEAFLSDTQGRDHLTKAEIAIDENGKFLAIKVNNVSNMGAYLSNFAPMIATLAGTIMLTGLYDIKSAYVNVLGVFTNTAPIDAYRGAGRPEASHIIERLVDKAAQDLKMDPAKIRKINLIPSEKVPYQTPLGPKYDSGDFIKNLEDALKFSDWNNFESRKKEAKIRGKYRGIGIGCYVEAAAGSPNENVEIIFEENGSISVLIGTIAIGQGIVTAYSQILEELLGIEFDNINFVMGDTEKVTTGGGTGGSKSLMLGASAIKSASVKIIEKGKKIAAHLLEASESDIDFSGGSFTIKGTDKSINISQIAKTKQSELPENIDASLDTKAGSDVDSGTYPNGCHICELEIDKDTGDVGLINYTVVDDLGKVINPLLVEGQVHGGIVQGLGQVLMEHCIYDNSSGQLVTGSFMDYAMPRADNTPQKISLDFNEVLCTTNPLGIKGAGEAGTVGALGCIVNALVNALDEFGVSHIEMPATPESLWKVINNHTNI